MKTRSRLPPRLRKGVGQPQACVDEGAIAVADKPSKYEASDSEEDSATLTWDFEDGSALLGGGSESGASPSTQMSPHADDPLLAEAGVSGRVV